MSKRKRSSNWQTGLALALLAIFGLSVSLSPDTGMSFAMRVQGILGGTLLLAMCGLLVFDFHTYFRKFFDFDFDFFGFLKSHPSLADISHVDSMTGIEFEKFVADVYRQLGYRTELTETNDYGVDIIASKDGMKTAIQTKRYSKPITQAAIREVVAGMAKYRCSKCMVVTNATFTESAVELARVNYCQLIDGSRLAEMVAVTQQATA